MKNEWIQSEVTHCPNKGCSGMLLQNPFYHEEKYTDCDKYYIAIIDYQETEKPKDICRRIKTT